MTLVALWLWIRIKSRDRQQHAGFPLQSRGSGQYQQVSNMGREGGKEGGRVVTMQQKMSVLLITPVWLITVLFSTTTGIICSYHILEQHLHHASLPRFSKLLTYLSGTHLHHAFPPWQLWRRSAARGLGYRGRHLRPPPRIWEVSGPTSFRLPACLPACLQVCVSVYMHVCGWVPEK